MKMGVVKREESSVGTNYNYINIEMGKVPHPTEKTSAGNPKQILTGNLNTFGAGHVVELGDDGKPLKTSIYGLLTKVKEGTQEKPFKRDFVKFSFRTADEAGNMTNDMIVLTLSKNGEEGKMVGEIVSKLMDAKARGVNFYKEPIYLDTTKKVSADGKYANFYANMYAGEKISGRNLTDEQKASNDAKNLKYGIKKEAKNSKGETVFVNGLQLDWYKTDDEKKKMTQKELEKYYDSVVETYWDKVDAIISHSVEETVGGEKITKGKDGELTTYLKSCWKEFYDKNKDESANGNEEAISDAVNEHIETENVGVGDDDSWLNGGDETK